MEIRKPKIDYTHSPIFAEHDMACAICREYPAVIYLNPHGDYFQPCRKCQSNDWQTIKFVGWKKIFKRLFVNVNAYGSNTR